ncbi:LysR substrate-binding domain-containing protein [Burkholderia pseudomallei]|uniref:LysR substrate-binding domain-containing protein n=1 Tax=Burkholderia pseudomallei TaxID=28450 RepID=UPI00224F8C74|nr:LysR substrate-binding domain-containing protein [Burkholderia pseudomallei]UZU19867.1 LysR substrate-binding domain-containing protein [Burkholderia pseudomallei]
MIAHRRQQASSPLRVSLPVSLGRRWALPALLDVAQRHPLLRLDLSFTDRRSDLVDEGIDRAVRIGDPGGGSASLACRGLGRRRSASCASPAFCRSPIGGAISSMRGSIARCGSVIQGAAARALRAAASAAGARRRARRPLISRGAAGLGAAARARGVARARRAAGGLAIACRRTVFRNRV